MRRGGAKKRRDASEPAIIKALKSVPGSFVQQCHGAGAPDLIARVLGVWKPIECKSEKGQVEEGQEEYPIARTPEEALALFGIRLKC